MNGNDEGTLAFWNAVADDWRIQVGDDGDDNRRLNSNPVLWSFVGDVNGLAVLDAGCGTGYLSRKLHDQGAGSPATASWASASSQPRSPLSRRGSQATVRCGRSPRMPRDQPGQYAAGPGLDEDPRPGLVHGLDLCDEADGGADLGGEFARGPRRRRSPYGAAVRLDQTGNSGARTVRLASASANRSRAAATSGLWKAHATGRRFGAVARPRAAAAQRPPRPPPSVRKSPSAGASCGWRRRPRRVRRRRAGPVRRLRRVAATAAMVPGSSPAAARIAAARSALSLSRSASGSMAPAAQRATSSP